jgi:hypothetical protein
MPVRTAFASAAVPSPAPTSISAPISSAASISAPVPAPVLAPAPAPVPVPGTVSSPAALWTQLRSYRVGGLALPDTLGSLALAALLYWYVMRRPAKEPHRTLKSLAAAVGAASTVAMLGLVAHAAMGIQTPLGRMLGRC